MNLVEEEEAPARYTPGKTYNLLVLEAITGSAETDDQCVVSPGDSLVVVSTWSMLTTTAQYNTVQYSTVQYSTVQYRTLHNMAEPETILKYKPWTLHNSREPGHYIKVQNLDTTLQYRTWTLH